ncbi:hypothetical protein ACN47E_007591 [Coniothyrium glycines]
MATDSAQNSPFIRSLASSDKKTRDTALSSLRQYLSTSPSLSALDLLKLWKGLFYTLWMQDKPLQQQRLARDLASLPSVLAPGAVLPFLRAFWHTMAREWGAIEALRLDKYLYLIRQYVRVGLAWLAARRYEGAVVEGWNEVLREMPLNAEDVKVPNGLRYHVLDVWVDEMEKVEGEEWGGEGKKEALEAVLGPVERLSREAKIKTVREAARECLADERVRRWRGIEEEVAAEEEEGDDDEEVEWGGFAD